MITEGMILSLSELFSQAQRMYHKLDEIVCKSTREKEYQTLLEETAELFQSCLTQVSRQGIFSSNEQLEDINTEDLKYVLVEAYLGELVQRQCLDAREEIIKKSKGYLESFIQKCLTFSIVEEDHLVQMEDPGKNPEQQRKRKIERYKEEKQLKEQLTMFEKMDKVDEETRRNWILVLIKSFILKSLDSLKSLEFEEKILSEREMEQPPPKTHVPQVNKPFVLLSRRDQLRRQVFQPGHNLPTMTIDEYLEIERERGNIIQGGGQMPTERFVDWDNDFEADAEIMKLRIQDEYSDVNPRGSGNRMNRS